MDKILVSVAVPAISQNYEVMIPQHARMYEVQELIKHAVHDLSDGSYVDTETSFLCRNEDGTIINVNMSVSDLQLRNGSKLILF